MYLNLEEALKDKMPFYTIRDHYVELMSIKCDTDSYMFWKNNICLNLGEYNFFNDTTGQNLAFTCFCNKQRNEGNAVISDFYYIEKSAILDVFCIYVKSQVRIKYSNGILPYPPTYIISPICNYDDFFKNVVELILKYYSDPLFYIFPNVKSIFPYSLAAYNGEEVDYYRALFGHQGDISTISTHGDHYFNFNKWVK
jgi:hypothetical protein